MEYLMVGIYGLALLLITFFSLGQLHLTFIYLKNKKQKSPTKKTTDLKAYPDVTIQLPIYNEKYVVERLLQTVSEIEYPKEHLEIQVLDDSTDETLELVNKIVNDLSHQGFNIHHIQREERTGFKAGALEYGLNECKGEFIAIFDSDFLPKPEFLLKTLPLFANENVGMVQTRWGHVNEDYSLLTKLQAFGLDAHFTIEQTGRNVADSFINFNGTAGIWRKETIIDAGGWSADTLTEDLDLSYRAQIKGWKFAYLEDVVSPAELPILMSAIKSQQYRWNKGAAETARKNLWQVLTGNFSMTKKLHGLLHLLNSSIFMLVLTTAILSVPMLHIKEGNPQLELLFKIGSIFLIGFVAIAVYYWVANNAIRPHKKSYYITTFPTFMTVTMGLSLHNTIAVLEGYLGFKTPFIRTPKFNVKTKNDSFQNNVYIRPEIKFSTIMEGILSLYFLFGIYSGITLNDWGLLPFHLMLFIGFGMVFYYSLKRIKRAEI